LIPDGVLVTVPLPTRLTVRVFAEAATGENVAVTELSLLRLSVQVAAAPEQAPLQPESE